MSILEKAIGLLAPASCLGCQQEGPGLCEGCRVSEIMAHGERCWRCGRLSELSRTCKHCRWFGGPRFVWITTDYGGLATKLISAYKFGHQRFLAKALAQLLAETFLKANSDAQLATMNYLICAVPTAASRRRQRGFDHSALLAEATAKALNLPLQPLLGRLGQARQVGRRRAERLQGPIDNYYLRLPELVPGRNVLLIDDVLTTGGTLRAATKVLRRAGAKQVDALVFAKKL